MTELTKYQFKICEAVQLGLTHYYMGTKDKRALTQEDYELAYSLLPQLPNGWMQEQYDWQVFAIADKRRKRMRVKG